jgi:hypothetical protein
MSKSTFDVAFSPSRFQVLFALRRIALASELNPSLSEDYAFDDFEFALDVLAMISYSRADRTR